MSNIINAYLRKAATTTTEACYQYDYGQLLRIIGPALPFVYEVHFSNYPDHGQSVTQVGNADGVPIPDALLATGKPIYAWIYLHTAQDDGETEYAITIPVIPRAEPTNDTPTPVQQDVITETIAALNSAVAIYQERDLDIQDDGDGLVISRRVWEE